MQKSFIFICLIFFATKLTYAQKESFYSIESVLPPKNISIPEAEAIKLYNYFNTSPLFIWNDYNNCEDRANAIGILLDAWNVPNYKVWVFSGTFLEKDKGLLTDRYGVRWKYHVATCIPVNFGDTIKVVVIDPSTSAAVDAPVWANNVVDVAFGYYFFTEGKKYIWTGEGKQIGKSTFIDRNTANYEFTIEGLTGYNGKSLSDKFKMKTKKGKAKIQNTKSQFEALRSSKPVL